MKLAASVVAATAASAAAAASKAAASKAAAAVAAMYNNRSTIDKSERKTLEWKKKRRTHSDHGEAKA